MSQAHSLTIAKQGRRFVILAGVAVLASYRTQAEAEGSLAKNHATLSYWAGSAGVCIQNTPARIVHL
ncbi:hypothetical protein [Pseudorhodoferax sp. Leaf265]|uniref:hypothetical protein n=1 Tax=Pseudorhodoferax sp. Leaf265 TaxID=1736315 RepID=UPI0006FA50C8|nr:hypothetical protein [Pseudorhodoferax sp. Leaf265]KQP02501.1 hypothetical protein ASF45_20830 [Pseudorhodoferax sp. Leaf265]